MVPVCGEGESGRGKGKGRGTTDVKVWSAKWGWLKVRTLKCYMSFGRPGPFSNNVGWKLNLVGHPQFTLPRPHPYSNSTKSKKAKFFFFITAVEHNYESFNIWKLHRACLFYFFFCVPWGIITERPKRKHPKATRSRGFPIRPNHRKCSSLMMSSA